MSDFYQVLGRSSRPRPTIFSVLNQYVARNLNQVEHLFFFVPTLCTHQQRFFTIVKEGLSVFLHTLSAASIRLLISAGE